MVFVTVLIYFFITIIEERKISALEKEALLFSLFVNLLIILLIFRESLLNYGLAFIWQNTPTPVLADYYKEFTIIEALELISPLLLLFGVFGFIVSLRNKQNLFLSSTLVTTLFFLWLKIIPFLLGLVILTLSLAGLSSFGLRSLFNFIKYTKFAELRTYLLFAVIILLIASVIVPSFILSSKKEITVDNEVIKGLEFLNVQESDKEAAIIAPYEYGHAITYFSRNLNVADSLFLLAPDAEKRVSDIDTAYLSKSETQVIEIAHHYNARYIILNQDIKEKYNVTSLEYVKNKECFSKFYDEGISIYRIKCK